MSQEQLSSETGVSNCDIRLCRLDDGTLLIDMKGHWVIDNTIPDRSQISNFLESSQPIHQIKIQSSDIKRWDSVFLIFIIYIKKLCKDRGIECRTDELPQGVPNLLRLIAAVPEVQGLRKEKTKKSVLFRLGELTLLNYANFCRQLEFLGELCLSFKRMLNRTARYRSSDVWLMIEECGPKALPIVTLISILVGLILAFVGAVQLSMFGAQLYIANLVGLGMAREMGAMMTAVIMAGRTGAAYAAQLGTMKVNEEIDALKTMGISPMDFLVLPRVVALVLMMPLLCLYADFMGILGGMVVGVGMLDLTFVEYYTQTKAALGMRDFNVGLFKSAVFGVLVAVAGCMRGMESGRSSSAVGEAATRAVVTGIVWIIVSDAILTVVYNALGV